MQMVRYMRVLVGALLAAGLLGACSAHVELGSRTANVDKVKLAEEIKTRLEEQAGAKADSVKCEDDLPAKVGATRRCVLTAGSKTYGVTVKANSVEDGHVKFDIKVDDGPMAPA